MSEAAQTEWLNAIPAAIFVVQHDNIAFANRAACAWVGYPAQELSGTPFANLLKNTPEPDIAHLKCRDGGLLAVKVTRAEIEFGGTPAQMITALKHDPASLYR